MPLWLAALALMVLTATFLVAPSAGALTGYTVVTNPNATRTVTWNLSDPSAFVADNITFQQGKAQLAFQNQSLAWTGGADFATNGTGDANITAAADGLELAANETNLVPNGDFSSSGSWSYSNSTDGNVTAGWDPAGSAVLGHVSNSTQVIWDGLEPGSLSNWATLSSPNCNGSLSLVTSGQKQGSGMFRLDMNVGNGCSYVGIQNTSADVNWSAYDTLLIWVNLTTPTNMGFNVSAIESSRTYWTATQSLVPGWNDVEVNLTPLGLARDPLSSVTLRFLPMATGSFTLYIDDVRGARNVEFNGTASIRQSLMKPTNTSAAPGTAQFSFDWLWTNQTGVQFAEAAVSLEGPGGSMLFPLPTGTPGQWSRAQVDVSSAVAASGNYNVSIAIETAANTTDAIDASVRLDDVSLTFPARENGTYVSARIDLGTNNLLANASLNLTLPSGTDINVTLSGAMQPNPYGSPWDFQLSWNHTASFNLQNYTAQYIQVTARLNTTNQSVTPTLRGLVINGRHFASVGTLTTAPFIADGSFLFWSRFDAMAEVLAAPTDTNVAYYINPGTGWFEVYPGEAVPHYTDHMIQVRAVLESSVGWFTPSLDALSVTYDFLGALSAVHVTPANQTVVAGGTLQFNAAAMDAGGHLNRTVYFTWTTDDPGGSVSPTGLFRAGQPGTWNVTAYSVSTIPSYSDTIQVTVTSVVTPGSAFPLESMVLGVGVVALVAALGYAIFEFGVRRAFAIDDFFLIARDGRLMSHNTRRLLPDQDEDTLSGMLTAINSFVHDAWREENGHIRRMVFGGKTTLIERGKHVFLAAVYSGRVPSWATRDLKSFVTDLEAHFGSAFERWNGSPEDLQHLREVMGRFASRLRYSRRRVWRPLPEGT